MVEVVETKREIELVFPDGRREAYDPGVTGMTVVEGIGPGLAKAAVAMIVDGEMLDLMTPLSRGGEFRVLTDRDAESLAVTRSATSAEPSAPLALAIFIAAASVTMRIGSLMASSSCSTARRAQAPPGRRALLDQARIVHLVAGGCPFHLGPRIPVLS